LSIHKYSGGGVMITLERIFDVEEPKTASSKSLVVVEASYELFVRDFEQIFDNSLIVDLIIVIGSSNLP
jgi:hypothetical protein